MAITNGYLMIRKQKRKPVTGSPMDRSLVEVELGSIADATHAVKIIIDTA